MKHKLVVGLTVICFSACNAPKEEDNVPTSKIEVLTSLEEDTGEDTARAITGQNATNQTNVRKVAQAPLLIARGSEPGWYAEFFPNHAQLVLDYGKDTVKIDHNFSNIVNDNAYAATVASVSNNNGTKKTIAFAVNLNSTSCTEASGEKRDKSIVIKYNGKEYKGCAYQEATVH